MKVWMRPRRAGLIASPQRSMSFVPARERPHTTAFLVRLAISLTARKSPSEAIGKPASMMSTPIWSRSSAISSFSSWVMVAPGDCSPSRRVVSKMTTRSFSDCGCVVMASSFSMNWLHDSAVRRARVPLDQDPLSAQARTPSRPSGAGKEQVRENACEGGVGPGKCPPNHRATMAAHRHAVTLVAEPETRGKW